MPRNYWFHAVQHACRMVNQIPIKVDGQPTTSFELVHRTPPDSRTWFPLFGIVYFYNDKNHLCNSSQSKSMVGIAAGCSTKTNELSVCVPNTKQCYEPDTYNFDPSRCPSTEFPTQIHCNVGTARKPLPPQPQ